MATTSTARTTHHSTQLRQRSSCTNMREDVPYSPWYRMHPTEEPKKECLYTWSVIACAWKCSSDTLKCHFPLISRILCSVPSELFRTEWITPPWPYSRLQPLRFTSINSVCMIFNYSKRRISKAIMALTDINSHDLAYIILTL